MVRWGRNRNFTLKNKFKFSKKSLKYFKESFGKFCGNIKNILKKI